MSMSYDYWADAANYDNYWVDPEDDHPDYHVWDSDTNTWIPEEEYEAKLEALR